jgi:hypothetical protein
MEQGLEVMKTALRVLNNINGSCDPDPADLEELRQFLPLLADAPPDKLACGVIRQVIKLSCLDCILQ